MSEAADFEGLPLARLHEAAAKAGIEGFRKMRKEDLAVLPKDDRYLPTVPAFFKVIKRREMIAQGFPLIDIYPREIDKGTSEQVA